MTDGFAEEYPEAAEHIREAVEEHGEEWVLENYYWYLYPLTRLMDMPRREELPFFDETEHDTFDDDEIAEMFRLRREYVENLKAKRRGDEDA